MFLLTNLLFDVLLSGAPSRVVNIASTTESGGRIDFDDLNGDKRFGGWAAYSNSKLAELMFTYELASRLESTGVTVNAVHPGAIRTNLGHGNSGLAGWGFSFVKLFFASPEKGARTVIYLASSPEVDKVSGKYFANCHLISSSRLSHDEETRARLWKVSAQLTRLPLMARL
ncbi:MAG TPA: SDR family NAD(P)-dependent oxidoreductase [Nitrososphaerales archaeon]|nr:SDR family NAD(P)-dependent oxidoreductase [Nitrososphaerales archaeon]